VFTVFTVVLFA